MRRERRGGREKGGVEKGRKRKEGKEGRGYLEPCLRSLREADEVSTFGGCSTGVAGWNFLTSP